MSADGRRWFLLNASPDVRSQLSVLPSEPAGPRDIPIEGAVLTDGELDHSLGLALLREGGRFSLYATPVVAEILEHDSKLLAVTRAFAEVPFTPLERGRQVALLDRFGEPVGLTVEAFPAPGHPPRFARKAGAGHTVGLLIRDGSGATCAYLPGCGDIDATVEAALRAASIVLFDGTFWRDDELVRPGIATRTAREMGHIPIADEGGSLEWLAKLDAPVVYVHINNTNPILLERSPERAQVVAAGLMVGEDGMRFSP